MAYVGALAAAIFVVNTVLFTLQLDIAGQLAAFPIAAGIAIVRYQLFDIDRIINRTLVYALVTATLLCAYVLLVLGFSGLMRGLNSGDSSIVTAVSTLAVAALFQPARKHIQRIVDQRFNRSHYDAAPALDDFNSRLREDVDLGSLSVELLDVVDSTMQPVHVSLWLRPGRAS